MTFPTQPLLLHTLRFYTQRAMAPTTRGERVGIAAITAYCAIAFSAPFAGAALVSRKVGQDKRYANLRPLSFRDCLPASPLSDYAGAVRR